MTPTSCPEYGRLDSLDELETFHARIELARLAGAITVDRAAYSPKLERLRIASLELLAQHLGVQLLSAKHEAAQAQLSAHVGAHPVLDRVLDSWKRGGKVRNQGPEAVGDLLDAVRAFDERSGDIREEKVLRRESIRLFHDSKRLEELVLWVDVLATGELHASGLTKRDIWATLGLRREPHPMLIAGHATVRIGNRRIALPAPYLGIPVDAVDSVECHSSFLMTIENLASFHDAARTMPPDRGTIIYTAGMPSPAWRTLYGRILRELPTDVRVYHWGDIDEGGYRIAATLGSLAANEGKRLLPWAMSPTALPEGVRTSQKSPSPTTLARMIDWATRAGWPEIACDLTHSPLTLEQEALEATFPE